MRVTVSNRPGGSREIFASAFLTLFNPAASRFRTSTVSPGAILNRDLACPLTAIMRPEGSIRMDGRDSPSTSALNGTILPILTPEPFQDREGAIKVPADLRLAWFKIDRPMFRRRSQRLVEMDLPACHQVVISIRVQRRRISKVDQFQCICHAASRLPARRTSIGTLFAD